MSARFQLILHRGEIPPSRVLFVRSLESTRNEMTSLYFVKTRNRTEMEVFGGFLAVLRTVPYKFHAWDHLSFSQPETTSKLAAGWDHYQSWCASCSDLLHVLASLRKGEGYEWFGGKLTKCQSSSNTDENYTSDLTVKAKFLFPNREIMSRLVLYPLLFVNGDSFKHVNSIKLVTYKPVSQRQNLCIMAKFQTCNCCYW